MASPIRYLLYNLLGFQKVKTFYIQVPGKAEKLTLEAIMWRPES